MSTSPEPNPYDFSAPLSPSELSMLNGGNTSEHVSEIDLAAEAEAQAEADDEALEEIPSEPAEATEETHEGQEPKEQASEPDGEQGEAKDTKEPEAGAWISQDVLDYAATYGLSDADVSRFESQSDFEKHTTALDKYLAKLYGDNAEANQPPQGQSQPSDSPAEPIPADTAAAAPVIPDRPGFKNGKIDLEYFKANYEADDPILAAVEHSAAMEAQVQQYAEAQQQLKSQNDAVLKHLAQQEQYNQANAFHSAIDSYSPEFFGKTVDAQGNRVAITTEQQQRRTKILEAANRTIMPAIMDQMRRSGDQQQEPPTYQQVVHRAAQLVYSDELAKLETEKRATALREQSKKIRSVAKATNRVASRVPNRETASPAERLINDPENIAAWEQLVKEGVVAR